VPRILLALSIALISVNAQAEGWMCAGTVDGEVVVIRSENPPVGTDNGVTGQNLITVKYGEQRSFFLDEQIGWVGTRPDAGGLLDDEATERRAETRSVIIAGSVSRRLTRDQNRVDGRSGWGRRGWKR
jgi:hypothetical protein